MLELDNAIELAKLYIKTGDYFCEEAKQFLLIRLIELAKA
jgi:hypothetical protein